MKKFLGIVVLSLVFYSNPLLVENSKAGLFSSPLEKCMDRVIKYTFFGDEEYSAKAAQLCQGANKGTSKCMDRIIKGTFYGDKEYSAKAAKLCTGN